MLLEALRDRLEFIEQEILRLTKRASQAPNQMQQDNDWSLAKDLQREARQLRSEIRKLSEPQDRVGRADAAPTASSGRVVL